MNAALLVSVAEYMSRTPDPDCEFLEGRLVERKMGEIGHGDAQGRTYAYVLQNFRQFWTAVEVRVQVRQERFRVPDVTIVRGPRPQGRIITAPPEVVVEVLSPDDRAAELQEKIDDYLAFGVSCVWVINPDNQRAWIHTNDGSSHEVKDGFLRNPAGDLSVPLNSIFPPDSNAS